MLLFTLAAGALAADEADLEAYLDQRLEVVQSRVSTVYAKGYDGSGSFWFVVDHDGRPLDAVDFARRVGEVDLADNLHRRRRQRTAGGAALLGVGVAASAFALLTVPIYLGGGDLPPAGDALAVAAVPCSLTGLVGGTLVLSGGLKQRHPAIAYSQDEATDRVRAYNAGLREEILGPP